MHFRKVFIVAGLGLALSAAAAEANILFPSTFDSNPSDGASCSGGLPGRDQGRKGLLFHFKYFDGGGVTEIPGGFPLNLGSASVALTIGANPPLNCTAGSAPAAGQCTFRAADGPTTGNGLDYVEVLYNGDFAASQLVSVQVGGVKSAMGETQDPNPSSLTFTTCAAAPRSPIDIELVFDKSGSMGWPAVPAGATTRMQALKSASQVLLAVVQDHAMVGDKIGLVTFNGTAGVTSGFVAAQDPAPITTLQGQINGLSPGGSTSIGDGLRVAKVNGFDTDAGPAKRVVLFSDGEQNTPPNATPGGGGALDVGGSPYPPEIVVCPVTAGNMSAVGFSLQQNIANSRCNGRNAHIEGNNQTFLEADLQTHFAQLASTTIFGDKLEPARDLTGTLAPLATATESFRANPEDVSLSVILGWEGRGAAEGRVVFTLEAPDGTAIDLGGRTRFGTRFSITTLPLPVIQGGVTVKTRGEWKLHLASANLPTTANYHLIVLLDNRSLTSDFTSPIADPGTGEAIPLRVSLREGGAPVTGATVKALVIGPKEGLGDILSSAFGGNITPPAQDPGANPLANGKLLALQNDASFAGRFGVRNLPVVTLRDDGTGGDATANDGLYSGSFQAADEEGHYHFFYSATGNAPANGDFERSWHSSVFVRPKPDPTNTTFQVLSIVPVAGSLRVTLSAQPRDRFRNLLGPGYLGSLSIQVAGGTVVSPLADKLDGSYEISYDIPSGSNPDATLEVLGKPVIVRPLGNLPGGSTLLPPGSGGGAGGWRLSLHLGRTDPRGHLGTFTDGGPSFGLDLEKAVNSHFSCELYGGQDRFDTNLLGGSDVKLSMLTLRGRWYFLTGSVQPSVFAGAGLFHENGGSTTGGVEVGAAVDWWLWPNVALEASAAFRNADGGNRKYGLLQAGARIKL